MAQLAMELFGCAYEYAGQNERLAVLLRVANTLGSQRIVQVLRDKTDAAEQASLAKIRARR
jgi:hypothetical protein